MFIKNISTFLNQYENIELKRFLQILETSNTKNFNTLKFEKDFLLTLILIKFGEKYSDLVFKWGTCLNKIYFPYFRLSEDLDFVLNVDGGRAIRKTLLKDYEENFIKDLALLGLTLRDERTKFDEYRLALFTFEYESVFDSSRQTIKIDISLKRPLQLSPVKMPIRTIFRDAVLGESIFSAHTITCIDLTEALAEKMRAALTRSEPAIRDFFDIWYVRTLSDFDFENAAFRALVSSKLAEVDSLYTLETHKAQLKK